MEKIYIIQHECHKVCECGQHEIVDSRAYKSLDAANAVLDEIEKDIDSGKSHHFNDAEFGQIEVEKLEPIGFVIYKRELYYKWLNPGTDDYYISMWTIQELKLG